MRKSKEGVTLAVRVRPNAREDRIVGRVGDVLQVKVGAPPQEGKANSALIRLLSETLGMPRSCVSIVRGEHSRDKRVLVEGLGAEEIERKLEKILSDA
ncbi:MAG TPA: DUF167 domain-containing protein [Nitrospiria bacterium]|nr:DUF167 domain-containing protein [Nitrospiria bacterium]